MLADFELLLLGFGKQIPYAFIIDFKHTNFDFERARSILVAFDLFKDGVAYDGNESFISAISDHGVGFA
jgi:hypothetical protein